MNQRQKLLFLALFHLTGNLCEVKCKWSDSRIFLISSSFLSRTHTHSVMWRALERVSGSFTVLSIGAPRFHPRFDPWPPCCLSKLSPPTSCLSSCFLHTHPISSAPANPPLSCLPCPFFHCSAVCPPPALFPITSCCTETAEPNFAWQQLQKKKQGSRLSHSYAK